MKISIVTAYYNRKSLFYETLKSITKSKFRDFELIAVDDGSLPEHRLEGYLNEFPFMKIIRLEPENKWYVNPCVPFNIGIHAAIGDIIVLQNPECLHVGDILTYVNENIDDTKYIAISAYVLGLRLTETLPMYCDSNTVADFLKGLPQEGWINHSKHKPLYYNYCSAITKKNIDLLGGFDEKYAYGVACDDDEFVIRVKRLGLKMIIVDDVSVIHQFHSITYQHHPNFTELLLKNRKLLEITKSKKEYKVN
jgi:GT2 family glycosyltransferase